MLLLRQGCRGAVLKRIVGSVGNLSGTAEKLVGSGSSASAEALLLALKPRLAAQTGKLLCRELHLTRGTVSGILGARTIHNATSLQSTQVSRTAGDETTKPQVVEKEVLYQGRWMVPFRVLVRLKLFQLAGVASLAIPLNSFLLEGTVSGTSVAVASALLLGCGVVSTTLWYYSRRYVGELSLVKQPGKPEPAVCFSVLDFWGNREDNFVRLEDIVPPLKDLPIETVYELALQPLIPVDVSGDRQYYVSLRHGVLTDKHRLIHLLEGKHNSLTDMQKL